jgi:acetyltransferase-like isoleucine patch superfamily enzyme/glycosyltransferase involved in cell wall biosynthesis
MLLPNILRRGVGFMLRPLRDVLNRNVEQRTAALELIARHQEERRSDLEGRTYNLEHNLTLATVPFSLSVQAAARGLAATGNHGIVLPTDAAQSSRTIADLKVGFFGNIANNAYNFVKCLRRICHDAELVIGDGWFDTFVMNRPFWEDVDTECVSYEDGLQYESRWEPVGCVHRVAYDLDMQVRYQNRYSATAEVQELYRKAFGIELAEDRAFLLAQHMGHWPYIVAMARYDVIQFSGASICMAPFCPRPYVVFPTGGDLFTSPFEETIFGLLMRAGYRGAAHLLVCETNYPEYLDRLATSSPRTFAGLMMDTDTYSPGDGADERARWQRAIGGERFVLGVCRQSWEWKGNDRLVRAFARFCTEGHDEWRLVLQKWGPDVERCKSLIAELELSQRVLWQPLCSKPTLRKRQRAADVVADQFVMAGYGTSVLESMAAGKPVILAPPEPGAEQYLPRLPPFVGARTVDEILQAMRQVSNDEFRIRRGVESRKWVEDYHGYQRLGETYLDVHAAAAGLKRADSPAPKVRGQGDETTGPAEPRRQLQRDLAELHARLRQQMKERFNRAVSLGDLLTDRWERAKFLGFGNRSSIYDSALVLGDVQVGENTWIGPQCVLDGSGGLEIGSHCSIAAGCQVYSHDSVGWALSGGEAAYRRQPTVVGNACYLGPGVVITAGATLGDHCLVGALSLVKGDVPSHSIVVGVPARIVGKVVLQSDGSVRLIYDKTRRTPDDLAENSSESQVVRDCHQLEEVSHEPFAHYFPEL